LFKRTIVSSVHILGVMISLCLLTHIILSLPFSKCSLFSHFISAYYLYKVGEFHCNISLHAYTLVIFNNFCSFLSFSPTLSLIFLAIFLMSFLWPFHTYLQCTSILSLFCLKFYRLETFIISIIHNPFAFLILP
jgi:hypothetical protein